MLIITLALTVLVAQLFPVATVLHETLEILGFAPLAIGHETHFQWLINYVPALIVSWWALRHLNVAPFARELTAGRRWIKIGIVLYPLYVSLALGGLVLSSIPYGGGTIPLILDLLLLLTKACLFAGLAIALCKELPAAQGSRNRA